MRKRLKGIIFAASLFITSFLGSIFFLFPFLFLMIVSPRLYRKLIDSIVYYWFLFVVALVEYFLGIEVVIEFAPGIKLNPKDKYLIIMNHNSRVDWLFFWSCLYRIEFLLTHKIILKAPLKRIPGAGWAMQMANFIFINRKWEMDQLILASSIDYFADLDYPYKILLFPEGTDFSPSNIRKSREFAVKHGLPVYRHLLQPRTTGFVYLVEKMRQDQHLNTILDVTVSYYNSVPCPNTTDQVINTDNRATPYHLPPPQGPDPRDVTTHDPTQEVDDPFASPCTETGILRGQYPDIVKFRCRTYDASSDLPIGSEALAAWCRSLWSEKDGILEADHRHHYGRPGINDTTLGVDTATFEPPPAHGRYSFGPGPGKGGTDLTPIFTLAAWFGFVGLVLSVLLVGPVTTGGRWPVAGYMGLACLTFTLLCYMSPLDGIGSEGRPGGGIDRLAIDSFTTRHLPYPSALNGGGKMAAS